MPNSAAVSSAPQKLRTSDLIEPFFQRRAETDKATHQVMGQERGTLRRFIEVAGDRPIDRPPTCPGPSHTFVPFPNLARGVFIKN